MGLEEEEDVAARAEVEVVLVEEEVDLAIVVDEAEVEVHLVVAQERVVDVAAAGLEAAAEEGRTRDRE